MAKYEVTVDIPDETEISDLRLERIVSHCLYWQARIEETCGCSLEILQDGDARLSLRMVCEEKQVRKVAIYLRKVIEGALSFTK